MVDNEDSSIEFIEDPYFNPQDTSHTPSLDDLDGLELDDYDWLEDLSPPSYHIHDDDEFLNVEAEFVNVKKANNIIKTFFKRKFSRQVRVTYCDLTKPYLAKLPKDSNFRKFLDITISGKFSQTCILFIRIFQL